MTNTIQGILDFVHKTNPGMTKERLVHEMGKSAFSSKALLIVSGTPENAPAQCWKK